MASAPRNDRPAHGAMTLVISESPDGRRYLLLHNSEFAIGEDGDWAWGAPSGCREPDETIMECAVRELAEETGIVSNPCPVLTNASWAIFFLLVPWGTSVKLDPSEHNSYMWATEEELRILCRPSRLLASHLLAMQHFSGT